MLTLDDRIAKSEAKLKRLEEDILYLKKQRTISCGTCKAAKKISAIDLQVIQYYISPSGCTDGDYWTEGNSPEFNITCECGTKTRYHDYDRADWQNPKPISITKLISDNRRLFKSEAYVHRGQQY